MIRPTTPAERSAYHDFATPSSTTTGETLSESRRLVVEYGVRRPNKAHTATANRIARRYQAEFNQGEGYDIQTPEMVVEVETTATMVDAMQRLEGQAGQVYIALTNKDAVTEALRVLPENRVGIMDPYGNIVRPAVAEMKLA